MRRMLILMMKTSKNKPYLNQKKNYKIQNKNKKKNQTVLDSWIDRNDKISPNLNQWLKNYLPCYAKEMKTILMQKKKKSKKMKINILAIKIIIQLCNQRIKMNSKGELNSIKLRRSPILKDKTRNIKLMLILH